MGHTSLCPHVSLSLSSLYCTSILYRRHLLLSSVSPFLCQCSFSLPSPHADSNDGHIVNSVMGSLMTETSQWWSATVRGRELNDKGSVHDEVDRWGVVLVCHPGVVWRMWYVTTKLARGGGWEVSDLRRSWQQLPWVAPSSWWGWEVGRKRLSTSCATGC